MGRRGIAAPARRTRLPAREDRTPAGAAARRHPPAGTGYQIHRAAARPRPEPGRLPAPSADPDGFPPLPAALLHAHCPEYLVALVVSGLPADLFRRGSAGSLLRFRLEDTIGT